MYAVRFVHNFQLCHWDWKCSNGSMQVKENKKTKLPERNSAWIHVNFFPAPTAAPRIPHLQFHMYYLRIVEMPWNHHINVIFFGLINLSVNVFIRLGFRLSFLRHFLFRSSFSPTLFSSPSFSVFHSIYLRFAVNINAWISLSLWCWHILRANKATASSSSSFSILSIFRICLCIFREGSKGEKIRNKFNLFYHLRLYMYFQRHAGVSCMPDCEGVKMGIKVFFSPFS